MAEMFQPFLLPIHYGGISSRKKGENGEAAFWRLSRFPFNRAANRGNRLCNNQSGQTVTVANVEAVEKINDLKKDFRP